MVGSFGLSPTIMLGIWHGDEWLKRYFSQPFYGPVEGDSPIFNWFISFINEKFIPLIFMCKCSDVYVDFMADMLMIFMSLLCWLYVCFMRTTMYGSQHVFTCE